MYDQFDESRTCKDMSLQQAISKSFDVNTDRDNIYQNILDVPDILRAVGWLQANIRSAKCDLQDLRIFASLRTQILGRNVAL